MEVIAPSSTTASKPATQIPAIGVRRSSDALLVVLFVAGLCAPLIGVQLGNHGWDIGSRGENRRMAAVPDLLNPQPISTTSKIKSVARFPGQFKYYLSDHFGFRNLLIRLHGTLMVKGLGVTSNPAVIVGKEGWLYLANDGSLEDWRNTDPFTPAQLEAWRTMLETRQQFCARRGIGYLFVLGPSKYDIYPEYMPTELNRVRTESRLDQLLHYLKEVGSPVQILDLRPPLLAAKKDGVRLFHKTDTHWNARGAWVAYKATIDAVRKQIPQTESLPASDFQPAVVTAPGMDLSRLLGLNDVYHEESLNLTPRIALRLPYVEQDMVQPITVDPDPKDPGKPRVVVFRDSFMTAVLPYLAESFGRGVYLWEDGFDERVIEAEHPDIVIQQIAQRKLYRPMPELEKKLDIKFVNGKWELASPLH